MVELLVLVVLVVQVVVVVVVEFAATSVVVVPVLVVLGSDIVARLAKDYSTKRFLSLCHASCFCNFA